MARSTKPTIDDLVAAFASFLRTQHNYEFVYDPSKLEGLEYYLETWWEQRGDKMVFVCRLKVRIDQAFGPTQGTVS